MSPVKSWYALTRGGHLVNASGAINGDARIWFCPSCRSRLILHAGTGTGFCPLHRQKTRPLSHFIVFSLYFTGLLFKNASLLM